VLPGEVSKSALHAMAGDGVPDGLVHHEPHAGAGRVRLELEMGDQRGRPDPMPGPDGPTEGLAVRESMRRGQHGCGRLKEPGRQTARLLRPLRRREDRMERPARVRMRRRKPCTLCRRRLFGWYVRLLTSFSFGGVQGRPPRWDQQCAFRLAPPTHGASEPSVDMRHRSTPGDRPTVRAALRQGQTTATGTLGGPVDEVLPAAPGACYVRGYRGSPPPSDQPDHDPV
jgi:hypothetical protein